MKRFLIATLLAVTILVNAQEEQKNILSAIYQNALTSYDAYNNLRELCANAPGRLVGSKESERAIQILKTQIEKLNPDTSYLQHYTTPSWRCKIPSQAIVYYGTKKESLNVVNLGLLVSTPVEGIKGELLEVHTLGALDSLGSKTVKDKIVFFNRPMDNSILNTFQAYGGAMDQHSNGAFAHTMVPQVSL